MKNKTWLAITLMLAVGVWSGSAQERTLTVGLDADPPNLDPAVSSAFVDRQVQNQIFEKLIDIDAQLKIIPALATSWKVSDLGLQYTFTLRQGVKFQDGTPFNAEAVKYNINRYQTLETSRRKGELAALKDVTVLSPYVVQLNLKYQYAPLLYVLTDRSGMMVSPVAAEKFGKDFTNNPVGSGPFQFVDRKRQDRITLKSFAGYWDSAKQPKFEQLIYRPFPDGDVRTANLLSGAVQIITPVDPKDLKNLASNDKTSLQSFAGLGYQGVWLNTARAPFNSKPARQAFAATLDREAIDRVVFLGSVTPAATVFPPNSPVYDLQFKPPVQNLELAKKKLAEAGKPGGFTFTLLTTPGTVTTQLAQLYQAFAASAGMTLKIEQVEFGTLLARADKKDFDALALGWSGRPDPDGNIFDFFITGGISNYGSYSNPRVDRLLTLARQARDMIVRKDIYSDAMKNIIDDAAYPITYFPKVTIGTAKGITGIPAVPDGIVRLKQADQK
jgi:peptide/nickel transport system substrate-binding protein